MTYVNNQIIEIFLCDFLLRYLCGAGRSNLRTPCRDLLSTFSSQSSLQSQDSGHHKRSLAQPEEIQSDCQARRPLTRPVFTSQPNMKDEEAAAGRSSSPKVRAGSPAASTILHKSSSSSRVRTNSPWDTTERSQSASPLASTSQRKLKSSQSHSSLRRNSVDQQQKKEGGISKKRFGFHFMGHSTNH